MPPTIQRKNKISQLSGAISSLFLELGSYFNFKALFPVMSMDIPAPTTLYQKLKKPCKGLFKVLRSH